MVPQWFETIWLGRRRIATQQDLSIVLVAMRARNEKGAVMVSAYEKRIIRVLDYIHENPGSDLSLDTLADIAAMSRFHWHRVFHGMTGETCADAVRRIRLNRAACWLSQTDQSVARIAARVGYLNEQSFVRAFRVAYRMTPNAFRNHGVWTPANRAFPKESETMFDVEVTEAPARRLAAIPHIGPYLEIGEAFEKVTAIATSRDLWPEIRGVVGIYYDDPNAVPESELRSHAGLDLAPATELPEGLEEVTIPGGTIARLRFKGSYAGLKPAYDYLYGEWLPSSGQEPANSPCYEVYLNAPADVAPEDLLTDICMPLKT